MTRERFKFIQTVPVANLMLDTHNPRIRSGADQADCIARILRKPKQLLALAADIASDGLSTAAILAESTGKKRYIVWDGNRRVTALKLLNDPSICPIVAVRHQLEGIKKRAKVAIPTAVDVYASDDREALLAEVLKRHSGQRDGAGQVNWSAFLRTVFLVGHGYSAADKRAAQLFMWAEEHGVEVDDDFPITSITRFLSKANLRSLGFDVTTSSITTLVDVDVAIAIAYRLASDFAPGGPMKVDDVFAAKSQNQYIKSVRVSVGLDEPSEGDDDAQQEGTDDTTAGTGREPTGKRGRGRGSNPEKKGEKKPPSPSKPSWDRRYLFSKTGSPGFSPSETKAANIVAELRKLEPGKTPIAVAALFRMLLEFSTNHYVRKNPSVKKDPTRMHIQIAHAAEYMAANGHLSAAECKVVLRRTRENEGLMNYDTLGAYMHSVKAHPASQGLNTLWDEVDAYVKACWA